MIPFHTPLTPAQQREAGLEETWPLAVADRVRFCELDPLNHVNNAAYMNWFETLRTLYIQHYGLVRLDPETDPRIVIRSGEIHYIKEMKRDETYVVTTRASVYRTTSLTLDSEIWSQDLRARFTCVIVSLEPDGSARRPLPAEFIQRIRDIDRATPA